MRLFLFHKNKPPATEESNAENKSALFLVWFPHPCVCSACSIPNSIGDDIEKACRSIFPLRDCFIRKVKMLKKPKFDIAKLMELHGDAAGEDAGAGVARPEDAPLVEEMKGAGGRL